MNGCRRSPPPLTHDAHIRGLPRLAYRDRHYVHARHERRVTSRREFARHSSAALLFGLPATLVGRRLLLTAESATTVHSDFPRHDPKVVEEFVRVAHLELSPVRAMVEAQPALSRASWDWGYGDWETGLGAAAHSGKREIVELLLAHGARPTIFSAAMLGQLEVVRAFVSTHPGIQRTLGPHGLTLMSHARAGGAIAAPVVSFLESVGEADRRPPSTALDAATAERLSGTYHFGDGERDHFVVDVRREQLGLQRPGTNRRFLLHMGGNVFFPSGVPSVRIAFRDDADGLRLTILDPGEILTAQKR